MPKFTINLLQPELFPPKKLLTLPRLAVAWGITLIAMVFLVVATNIQKSGLTQQVNALTHIKNQQEEQVQELEAILKAHRADSSLIEELDTLNALITHKRLLHGQLTNRTTSYIAGFATAMNELSSFHSKDISLVQVTINEVDMKLSGFARTPDAVPAWLARFDQSSVLAGKSFNHFSLLENNNNFIEFTVSTNGVEGSK